MKGFVIGVLSNTLAQYSLAVVGLLVLALAFYWCFKTLTLMMSLD